MASITSNASANGESDGASSSTSPPPSSLDEIEGPWQNPSRKLTGKIAYGDSSSNPSSSTSVVEKKSNLESGEKKRGRLGFWDESDVFKVVKKFIDNFAIDPNLTKIEFLRRESLLYATNQSVLPRNEHPFIKDQTFSLNLKKYCGKMKLNDSLYFQRKGRGGCKSVVHRNNGPKGG